MFISVHVWNFVHYSSDVDHMKDSKSDVMQESDLRVKHRQLWLWTLTLWMSWVPQMKRTELSPAPYFCSAVWAATIISGWLYNTSRSRVEYLNVLHTSTQYWLYHDSKHCNIDLTNPVEHSYSWEYNRSSASQEIPPLLYGTWRFNTAFTSTRNLSISWWISVQSMPPPIPLLEDPF